MPCVVVCRLGAECPRRLKVGILLVWQRHVGRVLHLLLVLLQHLLINLDFGRGEGRCGNKVQRLVTDELASEPAESSLAYIEIKNCNSRFD